MSGGVKVLTEKTDNRLTVSRSIICSISQTAMRVATAPSRQLVVKDTRTAVVIDDLSATSSARRSSTANRERRALRLPTSGDVPAPGIFRFNRPGSCPALRASINLTSAMSQDGSYRLEWNALPDVGSNDFRGTRN